MNAKVLISNLVGTNYYWSRAPGKYVDYKTGEIIKDYMPFVGTVREWYEGLIDIVEKAITEINGNSPNNSVDCIVAGFGTCTLTIDATRHFWGIKDCNIKCELSKIGTLCLSSDIELIPVYNCPDCRTDKIIMCNSSNIFGNDLNFNSAACGTITILDM
jgi:hypothetical protein